MPRSSFRILWITDPWETLDHPRDTSLRLMKECLRFKAETYWADFRRIQLVNSEIKVHVKKVISCESLVSSSSFKWGSEEAVSPSFFRQIHYRVDPPVDHHYLHPLQILNFGLSSKTEIVNPTSLLFSANEKMEGASLNGLIPLQLISSDPIQLEKFGKSLGRTILKPLHEAQSKGVERLIWKGQALTIAREQVALATQQGKLPVLLQEYLPEIEKKGEARLWFLDGKLLASVQKIPREGDYRINMDQGGRVAATRLTSLQKNIALKIGRHLKRRRIRLAAVDLIDDKITDFNFTSPGLLVQMEAITGQNLAAEIVRRLMNLCW